MIMTPQENTIISSIESNTVTVEYINTMLNKFGYYNEIEKKDFEWGKLYNLRKKATRATIFDSVIQEYFPRTMFGRQVGHTTALVRFIENNKDLKIGIMTFGKQQYDNIISSLDGNKLGKNVYWIRRNGVNDSLRGIKLDYIIIDSYGTIGINQKEFESLLINSVNGLRIIGIGN